MFRPLIQTPRYTHHPLTTSNHEPPPNKLPSTKKSSSFQSQTRTRKHNLWSWSPTPRLPTACQVTSLLTPAPPIQDDVFDLGSAILGLDPGGLTPEMPEDLSDIPLPPRPVQCNKRQLSRSSSLVSFSSLSRTPLFDDGEDDTDTSSEESVGTPESGSCLMSQFEMQPLSASLRKESVATPALTDPLLSPPPASMVMESLCLAFTSGKSKRSSLDLSSIYLKSPSRSAVTSSPINPPAPIISRKKEQVVSSKPSLLTQSLQSLSRTHKVPALGLNITSESNDPMMSESPWGDWHWGSIPDQFSANTTQTNNFNSPIAALSKRRFRFVNNASRDPYPAERGDLVPFIMRYREDSNVSVEGAPEVEFVNVPLRVFAMIEGKPIDDTNKRRKKRRERPRVVEREFELSGSSSLVSNCATDDPISTTKSSNIVLIANQQHLLMLSLEITMMVRGKIVAPLRQRAVLLREKSPRRESFLRWEVQCGEADDEDSF